MKDELKKLLEAIRGTVDDPLVRDAMKIADHLVEAAGLFIKATAERDAKDAGDALAAIVIMTVESAHKIGLMDEFGAGLNKLGGGNMVVSTNVDDFPPEVKEAMLKVKARMTPGGDDAVTSSLLDPLTIKTLEEAGHVSMPTDKNGDPIKH